MAWGLIGDVFDQSDIDTALACYCKALLCNNEESHKVGLRIKVAQILAKRNEYAKAKFEIQKIAALDQKHIHKLHELTQQDWFDVTVPEHSNHSFYIDKAYKAYKAENLLFEGLSWTDANLGKIFSIPNKNKRKYKVYIKKIPYPMEVSISENMVKLHNITEGMPIKIKGELDEKNIYKVYVLEGRSNGEMWDAFDVHVGVIDSVNQDKKLYHYLINQEIDGIIPFGASKEKLKEGDTVELKLSLYLSKSGKRFTVLDVLKTDKKPKESILKEFYCSEVTISGAVGFTDTDIFIPPYIVKNYQLNDGSTLSGVAVLNFNNKKKQWGWKVLKVM